MGIDYTLNFTNPFNISSNFSDVFGRKNKGQNDEQSATTGPNYVDGFMFSNDDDWLGYGGMLAATDSVSSVPSSITLLGYQQYSNNPTTKRPQPGYYLDDLPSGITRYVTYGGGVSVPALNKGFYFGGLRAANFGPINYPFFNESTNADVLSDSLIVVDMTAQEAEKWQNLTIPSKIPLRASPELVWIPVANSGVLIAIGGVILPEYDNMANFDNSSQQALSVSSS